MAKTLKNKSVTPKSSSVEPTGHTLPTTKAHSTHGKRLSTKQLMLLDKLLDEVADRQNLIRKVIKGR